MITLKVDTSNFDKMCLELAAIADSPPDQVLREEVGKVLSKAIDNTDAASVASIRQHHDQAPFTMQPASLYTPKRKRARKIHRGGKISYSLKFRYPDRLWRAIQRARAIDLKKRLAARGLAKQSWYKLGLLLGLSVDAPAYVKNAKPSTGKSYRDESANTERGTGTVAITISTSQPTLNAIGGKQALQKAIDGRVLYFAQNVIHDVFKYWWTAAKKYPGVY